MKVTIVLACLVAAGIADTSVGDLDNTMEIALGFVKDCQGDYILCVKEKLLRKLDDVRQSRTIKLADGVVLKSSQEYRSPKKVDLLPLESAARDEEVNSRLIDGVIGFFDSYSLEVKMDKDAKENVARSLQEGRGEKKKNMQMHALLGMMMAKMLFGKLFIVKLIALKALAVGKIALALAIILVVAYCLQQGHTKTTYEVIPHHGGHEHHGHYEHHEHLPVHIDHGYSAHASLGHEHGGYSYGSDWNKNLDDGQNLAYSAHSGHK